MGQSQSGNIKREELDELAQDTQFDQAELRAMFKQFKKDTGTGAIDLQTFKKVVNAMGITDEFLQDILFNVFDTNRDGQVTFHEFVEALSVMTRGKSDDKLEFAFKMYDLDGDGFITRSDMSRVMAAYHQLVGPLVTYSGRHYSAYQLLVDDFFEQMTPAQEGRISLAEYKEAALKNPDIIEGLQLFAKS